MNNIPKATHTGELQIGSITIECAVLEDGTRVLTQSGLLRAIGQSNEPAGQRIGVEEIPPFLASNNLKPLINKDLGVFEDEAQIQDSPGRSGGGLQGGDIAASVRSTPRSLRRRNGRDYRGGTV